MSGSVSESLLLWYPNTENLLTVCHLYGDQAAGSYKLTNYIFELRVGSFRQVEILTVFPCCACGAAMLLKVVLALRVLCDGLEMIFCKHHHNTPTKRSIFINSSSHALRCLAFIKTLQGKKQT